MSFSNILQSRSSLRCTRCLPTTQPTTTHNQPKRTFRILPGTLSTQLHQEHHTGARQLMATATAALLLRILPPVSAWSGGSAQLGPRSNRENPTRRSKAQWSAGCTDAEGTTKCLVFCWTREHAHPAWYHWIEILRRAWYRPATDSTSRLSCQSIALAPFSSESGSFPIDWQDFCGIRTIEKKSKSFSGSCRSGAVGPSAA